MCVYVCVYIHIYVYIHTPEFGRAADYNTTACGGFETETPSY